MTDGPTGPFESLVVLGESTVQGGGWLARTEERYPDILWKLLETAQEEPLRYHNAGVGASVISPASPGYEASAKPSAAERLDEEVIARSPDLLVIAYGLNDMRAGMPVRAFRAEMVKLLDRIRAHLHPMIVLVNVYYMTAYHHFPPFDRGSPKATQTYNRMLRRLAVSHRCVYADVWSAEAGCDHAIHADTVHANKIGNMLIAHKVFEAIAHVAPGIAASVNRRDADTEWTRVIRECQKASREPSDAQKETP